jgi:L-lysine 6-transaminase
MSNVRGRGLMVAFDLPNRETRDELLAELRTERVLALPSGERAIRFRPALNVTREELAIAVTALDHVLSRI